MPSEPVEGVIYGCLYTFLPPTRASQFLEQTTVDDRPTPMPSPLNYSAYPCPLFSGKIPLIYWLSILPWSYSPELLKKRRIYHNHSWKSTLNTTHCHNEKKLKIKNKTTKNLEKSRKKEFYYITTQSKMYCSILVSCLNKRLQSGGIEKKNERKTVVKWPN